MGIPLIDNLIINSNIPIDSRIIASSSTERDAIEYKYDGLTVFEIDSRTSYIWNLSKYMISGVTATSWDVLQGSGSLSATGSPNYIPSFNPSGTGLTNSSILSIPISYGIESNQKIGIGGTPSEALQVNTNYLSSAIGATSQPFVVHKGGGIAGPSTAIGENWYWAIGPGNSNFDSTYGSSIIVYKNGGFSFMGRQPNSSSSMIDFVDIGNTGITNFNNFISMTSSSTQPNLGFGTMYVDSTTNRWKVMESNYSRFISRVYDVYTTVLTQVGTANPTELLLESSIGSGSWSRISTGTYNLTVSGGFTGVAPEITGFVDPSTTGSVYYGKQINSNTYQITTLLSAGSPTQLDNVLNNTFLEIKIWNNISNVISTTTTTTTTYVPTAYATGPSTTSGTVYVNTAPVNITLYVYGGSSGAGESYGEVTITGIGTVTTSVVSMGTSTSQMITLPSTGTYTVTNLEIVVESGSPTSYAELLY